MNSLLQKDVNARIASVHSFSSEGRDLFAVATESNKMLFFSFEGAALGFEYSADFSEKMGRLADSGLICAIDPRSRCIGVHAYQGNMRIIPLNGIGNRGLGQHHRTKKSKSERKEFTIRFFDELKILDVAFLDRNDVCLAILYQDSRRTKLRVYRVDLATEELKEKLEEYNVDMASSAEPKLLALDNGGVVVLSETKGRYFYADNLVSFELHSPVTCMERVSGTRYLLGGSIGSLSELQIEWDDQGHPEFTELVLGEVSIPTDIAFAAPNHVLLASHFGNSQFLEISNGSVQVLHSFENLAPIVDFCIKENDGLSQIIACCNAYKHGSLKIIQNGIGVTEIAQVEAESIKALFSISTATENFLVLSFMAETTVLKYDNGEIDETSHSLVSNEETLFCGVVGSEKATIVQVTPSLVRIIQRDGQIVDIPNANGITNAHANGEFIVCSTKDGHVIVFDVSGSQVADIVVGQDVSCLYVSTIGNEAFVAVGIWIENQIRVYKVSEASSPLCQETLEEMVRSVVLTEMNSVPYLFVALGDGKLFSFSFSDKGKLENKKKTTIGTKPIHLTKFISNDQEFLFCACDRPAVVYSQKDKLRYDSVNIKVLPGVA